jgi:hypothetical protein
MSASKAMAGWRRLGDMIDRLIDRASSATLCPQSAPDVILHPPQQARGVRLGEKLGDGSSEAVYLARHLATNYKCPLRIIDNQQCALEARRSTYLFMPRDRDTSEVDAQ